LEGGKKKQKFRLNNRIKQSQQEQGRGKSAPFARLLALTTSKYIVYVAFFNIHLLLLLLLLLLCISPSESSSYSCLPVFFIRPCWEKNIYPGVERRERRKKKLSSETERKNNL
jgi:hypothetical protein